MIKKVMPIIQTVLIAVLIFSVSAMCFLKAPTARSEVERRELAQAPELSLDTLISGEFMQNFESYATDQFPFRDALRQMKSFASLYVFREMDNNNYYVSDGSVSRMDYPLNPESISYATERFRWIYNKCLDENNHVFVSVIPDKNAFMADDRGHFAIDYEALYQQIRFETGDFATYVDIADLLETGDFYATDTHWRQEKIVDVAQRLATTMGTSIPSDYTVNTLDNPFYGVHFYQSAIPFLEPDTIRYLTNDTINACQVFNVETNKPMMMYDMEKAYGEEPYDIFLSGSNMSIITIDNPNAATDKNLVIFRDSFGSSLTPLLAQGYAKVTVIDMRLVPGMTIARFVDFNNADVLFMYSSMVLNHSETLKR